MKVHFKLTHHPILQKQHDVTTRRYDNAMFENWSTIDSQARSNFDETIKQRDVTTQRYDNNLFEYFSVIDCFKEEIGIYF
jgi:hypothetical protein